MHHQRVIHTVKQLDTQKKTVQHHLYTHANNTQVLHTQKTIHRPCKTKAKQQITINHKEHMTYLRTSYKITNNSTTTTIQRPYTNNTQHNTQTIHKIEDPYKNMPNAIQTQYNTQYDIHTQPYANNTHTALQQPYKPH